MIAELLAIALLLNYSAGQATNNEETDSKLDIILNEIQSLRHTCSSTCSDEGCPSDFTYIPDGNKCYRFDDLKTSWDDARSRCASFHPSAHPIIIDDYIEQVIMGIYLDSINTTDAYKSCTKASSGIPYIPDNSYINVWTAGQRVDLTTQSSFVWKPSSCWREMKYTNWAQGDPNYYANNEYCVMLCNVSPNYKWCDLNCVGWAGLSGLCVLCEIDML